MQRRAVGPPWHRPGLKAPQFAWTYPAAPGSRRARRWLTVLRQSSPRQELRHTIRALRCSPWNALPISDVGSGRDAHGQTAFQSLAYAHPGASARARPVRQGPAARESPPRGRPGSAAVGCGHGAHARAVRLSGHAQARHQLAQAGRGGAAPRTAHGASRRAHARRRNESVRESRSPAFTPVPQPRASPHGRTHPSARA